MMQSLINVNTLQVLGVLFGSVTYIRYLCNRVKKQSNNIKKVTAMTLTTNDYYEIANQIEVGYNSIELVKDGETLYIDCTLESNGYVEDAYFDGTGAYVETERTLIVESVESYNEDGEQTTNNFEEAALQKVA